MASKKKSLRRIARVCKKLAILNTNFGVKIQNFSSGFQKVLIPSKNAKDLKELPKHIKDSLDIILVGCLEEVLENAFEHTFEDLAKKLDTLSKL